MTRYRDYYETGKNDRIFNYFTTGCNRDGLAIRALAKGLEDSPSEHKLVILLSDVKPNDVIQMNHSGSFVEYAGGQRHPEHRHGDPVPDLQGHQRHVRFHRE
ncbi:MAG: hypothetical protein ACLUIW_03290 [Dysosmobacter welbionis]